MTHTFFALFRSPEDAARAVAAVRAAGHDEQAVSVVAHRSAWGEDLTLVETDGREALVDGALLGAVGGAAASLLLGPAGLVGDRRDASSAPRAASPRGRG